MGFDVESESWVKPPDLAAFFSALPKSPSTDAVLIRSICTGVALLTALSTAKFSGGFAQV